jgi:cytochrome c
MTMKFVVKTVAAVAASLFALTAFAMPATPGTKDDAKALAERAAAHVKKVGFEQAVKDFTADQATWGLTTRDRLVYVYAYDYNGVALAHSVNGAVVGKELLGIKDPDGRTPIADSVQKAKDGGGFVEFKWSSPATKKIARGAAFTVPIAGKNAYVAAHAVLE